MLTAKLMYLFANLLKNPQNIALENKQNQLVKELFSYVHQNADKKLTLEAVAEKLGYSRGYLSGLFSACTGVRFTDYVNRLKILRAKELLDKNDGKRVLDIAFDCGFESANTFYRAYKKEFGKAPLED